MNIFIGSKIRKASKNRLLNISNVSNILKRKDEVLSLVNFILSKSILAYFIFPSLKDVKLFFKALDAWVKGEYEFDDSDKEHLKNIGVDVGICLIVASTSGALSPTTSGISSIFTILSIASTIKYVLGEMSEVGRNYEKNKALGI